METKDKWLLLLLTAGTVMGAYAWRQSPSRRLPPPDPPLARESFEYLSSGTGAYLTPEELVRFKRRAEGGDAAAAQEVLRYYLYY